MSAHWLYSAAFLLGLTGAVHCFGMCGGIVAALTLGLPQEATWRNRLPFLVAYNIGRISSYVVAGMLAGGLGAWATHLAAVHSAQLVLQIFAGLCMILLGLYLAGWSRLLSRVEQAGGLLWRRIEPFGRRYLPVCTWQQAWSIGLVWGWLPCGLVYSVLVWAISAGGAIQGGLLMFSFGLGTLPALLSMGAATAKLAHWMRRPAVRIGAGILVIIFGINQVFLVLRG